ncbi:hypothetical protein BH23CHL2_BH23CHL2_06810 [soil metagenome]
MHPDLAQLLATDRYLDRRRVSRYPPAAPRTWSGIRPRLAAALKTVRSTFSGVLPPRSSAKPAGFET